MCYGIVASGGTLDFQNIVMGGYAFQGQLSRMARLGLVDQLWVSWQNVLECVVVSRTREGDCKWRYLWTSRTL